MSGPRARGGAGGRRGGGGPVFPCARCGRPLRRATGERPPKLRCPRCRYLIYDYPRPCAGLLVVRDRSVLLLRRRHAPRRGFLDVPGGFMEAGESIEGAARRELREETGLTLGRVAPLGFYWDRYFLKGFGWFPTMNFYFVGRWRGGVPRAADDAASAEWMPLAGLGRGGARHAWAHMSALFRDLRRHLRPSRPARPRRALRVGAILLAAVLACGPARAAAVPDAAAREALQARIGRLDKVHVVGPGGRTTLLRPMVAEDGLHMRGEYHPPRAALIVIGQVPAPPGPVPFVPWSAIDAVQVHRTATMSGMLMGAVVGAALVGAGFMTYHQEITHNWDREGGWVLMISSTVIGGAALLGAAAGSYGEDWRTVYPAPPPVR